MDKATKQALQVGASPLVLALAKQMLGKKEYIGYCQSFVEKMTGSGWKGSSAIQAWQNAQNKVQGTQGIQPGDLVYLSANQSNKGLGHTGIYQGNNQFISATNNGVAQNDLNKWSQSTGQKLLGYIPQGERQPTPSAQLQSQVQQPQYTPQYTPLVMPNYTPTQEIPQSQINLPNPINQQQNTTTYGRITVPNL